MENILIIEDDPYLRNVCAKNLRSPDRIVRTAKNGKDGLRELRKEEPDLLLLDLLMPSVDGFSILEFIKENEYSFPVIVLSNITWNFDMMGCRSIGATDYFIKSSISIPALQQKVEERLRQRREERISADPSGGLMRMTV
ncbi:MAG: response regulator [Candidatus Peribacteraceae bacterium]|nr:response regulator [Candidatus Peribacteraceae bacterium]